MKLILTGGGTGGHIIPNIALIENFRKNNLHLEILYIGSKKGMEKEMIEKLQASRSSNKPEESVQINFYGITCGKLRRYFSWENFLDFFRTPIGILQSLIKILKFKPQVIFSKGGYVSFPVTVAGWLARVPVILHESDAIPGLSNKLSAKFAKVVCLSFEESKNYFKTKKVVVTGNPIREDVLKGQAIHGYQITGFNSNLPVILVMGGSLGATSINQLLAKALPKLLQKFQIIHITGKAKEIDTVAIFKQITHGNELAKRYRSYDYVGEDLKHLYSISTLIISRAGANSLAEISALNKPSIIIPLGKHASRGDQIINAEIFQKNHHCQVLFEEELNEITLLEAIDLLLKSPHNNRTASLENQATELIKKLILEYENRN